MRTLKARELLEFLESDMGQPGGEHPGPKNLADENFIFEKLLKYAEASSEMNSCFEALVKVLGERDSHFKIRYMNNFGSQNVFVENVRPSFPTVADSQ